MYLRGLREESEMCNERKTSDSNNQVYKGFSSMSFICLVTIQLIYFIYSLLKLMDGQSFFLAVHYKYVLPLNYAPQKNLRSSF